jgi:Surface antigen variable number repeat
MTKSRAIKSGGMVRATALLSAMRVAVLGGVCALLLAQLIRAQSPKDNAQTCPPACLSSDEFKELLGKKVYPKIIIDDVKFDGPSHLPDLNKEQEILSELKHREFDAGSDWLDDALFPVRNAWSDLGYLMAKAIGESRVVSVDSTYQHVVLTIHVNEGLRYKLGSVRFREADPDRAFAFPPEELRKLVPLQDGDIFYVEKIRECLEVLRRVYNSKGYIDFAPVPQTEIDEVGQRISLVIVLQEGEQFRVGKIQVLGLKPSKAAMLTSKLKAGDVFNRTLVDDFVKENLPALPVGASPHVLGVKTDFKKRTVDIVVDFRPRPKQMEF